MKKIQITIVALLTILSCKAQTPVIDIYGLDDYGKIQGGYYKDTSGFHNQFVGTWLYSNGSTSLKLVFAKRDQIHYSISNFYADFLVGEYQYIENGVEKVNTLSAINTNYGSDILDVRNHNILRVSCIYHPSSYPKCNDCLPNERRLRMSLDEPAVSIAVDGGIANSFVLRTFTENGVQKLKVWFRGESQIQLLDHNGNPSPINRFSLPFGQYTLIKQ